MEKLYQDKIILLLYPEFDKSKTRKASLMSSSKIILNKIFSIDCWSFRLHFPISVSFIFLEMRVRNSGKSISPFPSTSTSFIISESSAGVCFWPSELITVPSSRVLRQTLTMGWQCGERGGDEVCGVGQWDIRTVMLSFSLFPDAAISVFVKEREGLPELGCLLLRQKLRHDWSLARSLQGNVRSEMRKLASTCLHLPLLLRRWSLNINIYNLLSEQQTCPVSTNKSREKSEECSNTKNTKYFRIDRANKYEVLVEYFWNVYFMETKSMYR